MGCEGEWGAQRLMTDLDKEQATGDLKGTGGEEVAAAFISMLQVQEIPRPPPPPHRPVCAFSPYPSILLPPPLVGSLQAQNHKSRTPTKTQTPMPRVQDAKEVTSSNKCGLIKRLSAVYEGSGGSVSSLGSRPSQLFTLNFSVARGLNFWRLRANVLMFCVLAGRIHLFCGCRRGQDADKEGEANKVDSEGEREREKKRRRGEEEKDREEEKKERRRV